MKEVKSKKLLSIPLIIIWMMRWVTVSGSFQAVFKRFPLNNNEMYTSYKTKHPLLPGIVEYQARHRFDHFRDHFSNLRSSVSSKEAEKLHIVKGILCREVNIDVSSDVGFVTVLEATAESQEELVNWALEEDEEASNLKSGDPYGAVLWPAASVTAKYLLENLKNKDESCSVLELGAGTGLVSIAAALGGASKVTATDYESIPLELLKYASMNCNNPRNDGSIKEVLDKIETSLFDICDFENLPLPYADVVVAADIMYEPKTGRAMAQRTIEALKQNSRVIVGCSPGRPGRPAFLEELKRLGIEDAEFFEATGTTCSGDRHELICGKGSSSISETPKPLTVKLVDLKPENYNY